MEKNNRLRSFKKVLLLVALLFLIAQPMAIAQQFAFVSKTGQAQSYAIGDDGYLQAGVKWPAPRFTDNGDGTVTDNLTDLIWLKNTNCFGTKNWADALDAANNLAEGQCGLRDGSSPGGWHLANARELLSLIDYDNYGPALSSGHPFTDVHSNTYWSSTTLASRSEAALIVNMVPEPGNATILHDASKYESRGVWPVRIGNEAMFAASPVPKTGQTQHYATGDDGDLQAGVRWPYPRFTDNGDGTVTDNMTELIWLKNANCFGSKNWNDALNASNNLADGQCGLRDGSTAGQWHLANIKQLRSLIDHGKNSPLLPLEHPFTDVQADPYWSSTTNAGNIEQAWHMALGTSNGQLSGIVSGPKTNSGHVLAVRPIKAATIIIDIDIIPGSYPNSINISPKGQVSVAILTTDDFDAYDVDLISCDFAGAYPLRWKMEDIDKDGDHDMLLYFLAEELELAKDATTATLTGETFEGIDIIGTDSIDILTPDKEDQEESEKK